MRMSTDEMPSVSVYIFVQIADSFSISPCYFAMIPLSVGLHFIFDIPYANIIAQIITVLLEERKRCMFLANSGCKLHMIFLMNGSVNGTISLDEKVEYDFIKRKISQVVI